MTDWQAVAAALQAPIQPEDRVSAIAPLERLERAFRPLQQNIPLDTPLWDATPLWGGPVESSPIQSGEAQPE
ncbi:MAG TPA: hypothetical protein VIY49_15870 [Bryobacteraceae bacterium]